MMGIQAFSPPARAFPRPLGASDSPALERARGVARLSFTGRVGETELTEFYQSGCAKIRLPRVPAGMQKEAVLLNTAGGFTGGDIFDCRIALGSGATAVISTQAAERIYRSTTGSARIETQIHVDEAASLDWLPQETILFEKSSLSRRLQVEIAEGGHFLGVETIILGRAAMGEAVHNIYLADSWRVRRGSSLVFADGLRLDGDATEIMSGSATGGGATAFATLLLVSPDAEAKLDAARDALLPAMAEAGVSAWNGMLTARLAAPAGHILRADLIRLIETLRGVPMPRVWSS